MPAEYNSSFFENRKSRANQSASILTPFLFDLIQPKSMLDVGCALGSWLVAAKENGLSDILGIDGEYVDTSQLLVETALFKSYDLSKSLNLQRKFDMVLSLEVAEHIQPESAETFIDTLTKHAPVVAFSAAIPYQGGTHHYNEQWPDYWEAKFRARGYVMVDCIRPALWDETRLEPVYIQNGFVYVKESELGNYPKLKRIYEEGRTFPVRMVHPALFEKILMYLTPEHIHVRRAAGLFRGAIKNRILRKA